MRSHPNIRLTQEEFREGKALRAPSRRALQPTLLSLMERPPDPRQHQNGYHVNYDRRHRHHDKHAEIS